MQRQWKSRPELWVVTLALLILALAACGGGDDQQGAPGDEAPGEATGAEEQEPLRLAFFQIAAINAYGAATQTGAEQAAQELEAEMQVFDANFDASRQLAQMRDAIATGNYDGFVLFAVDGNAIVPVVREALDAGIKVSAVFTPLGPNFLDLANEIEGVTTTVGVSEREVAEAEAEMTITLCEGKDPCNVVYLPGLLAFPPAKGRFDVYREEIGKHPNVRLVASQEAGFEANAAVTAMQNILQANRNIDVVTTDGDQMAFGAERAITDAGLEGQIQITGNGGGDIGLKAIREGRWYGTVYTPPRDMGFKAAELLIQDLRGEDVPETFDFFEIQREADQGPIVNSDNIDNVEAQWPG